MLSESLWHIKIKFQKNKILKKTEMLKSVRNIWNLTYRGKTTWMAVNISSETMKFRRKWQYIFQALIENNCQPQIISLPKLTFRNEGKVTIFSKKN